MKIKDIGTGVSWTLLLFLGGIFSLTHIIPQYKITDWLAGIMAPRILPLVHVPLMLLLVMALLMLGMRFVDPSAFFAIPLLWTPLVDQLSASGIPPLVLAAPLLLMSAPFLLVYTNFWMAMGEGMTGKQGYSKGQLFRLACVNVLAGLGGDGRRRGVLEDDRSALEWIGKRCVTLVSSALVRQAITSPRGSLTPGSRRPSLTISILPANACAAGRAKPGPCSSIPTRLWPKPAT